MKVLVKVYDLSKYDVKAEKVAQVEYNINGFKVVSGGKEAKEIEQFCDDEMIDENHEYLVLELENGETATFRNSHVDMFRW